MLPRIGRGIASFPFARQSRQGVPRGLCGPLRHDRAGESQLQPFRPNRNGPQSLGNLCRRNQPHHFPHVGPAGPATVVDRSNIHLAPRSLCPTECPQKAPRRSLPTRLRRQQLLGSQAERKHRPLPPPGDLLDLEPHQESGIVLAAHAIACERPLGVGVQKEQPVHTAGPRMRNLDRGRTGGLVGRLFKQAGNPVPPPFHQVVDLVEGILHPLVVADKHLVGRVDRQPHRESELVPHRGQPPVAFNPQDLAPQVALRGGPPPLRIIAPQPDVQSPPRVPHHARGPIVVVVGVAPAGGHHLAHVGPTIAIGVFQSQDFGLVRHQQVVAVGQDAERCREPLLKQADLLGNSVAIAVPRHIHLPLQRTEGQAAIGTQCQRRRHQRRRKRQPHTTIARHSIDRRPLRGRADACRASNPRASDPRPSDPRASNSRASHNRARCRRSPCR